MVNKIIFLNGPKSSGKDTAANYITSKYENSFHYKFALPLKESVHKMMGLEGSLESLEQYKEDIIEYKLINSSLPNIMQNENGLTLREVYIYFSEQVMKPLFGEDIFGIIGTKNIENRNSWLTAISDSGFAKEANPVIKKFGAENCILLRIHRDGKTFSGDSRGYITLDNIKSYDLYNSDVNKFYSDIDKIVEEFIR